MDMRLFALVALLIALGTPYAAWAQADLKQDISRCLTAQTSEQCRSALSSCERALTALEQAQADPNTDKIHARVLNDTGWCENELHRYSNAERHHRASLTLAMRIYGPENAEVAMSLINLATVFKEQGKYEAAETLVGRALAMRQKLLGLVHHDTAVAGDFLASLLLYQRKYAAAEELCRQELEQRQKFLGPENSEIPPILNNLGSALFRQGKPEAAETIFRQALAMKQKLYGPEHPEVVLSISNLAEVLSHQGKYEEVEALLRQALAMKQKLYGPEHPEVARSINDLAEALVRQGKYERAESLHRQALGMRQKLLGTEHAAVATSLSNLALVLERQGKYESAETLLLQALGMGQHLPGFEHPVVAQRISNLGVVLVRQGKYEAAETILRQALAMSQRLLGAEHAVVAQSINNLAGALQGQGKYEAAETLLRQSLAIHQKLFPYAHPHVATSLDNLAGVLASQGKYEAAETLHRQALAMWQARLGTEHPDVAKALNNLAVALESQGHDEEAEKLHRQALAMNQKLLGVEHPLVAAGLSNLAGVLTMQGKYELAERIGRQALAMNQRLLGVEHPSVAASLNKLALVVSRQGKYDDAETLYRQAIALSHKLLGPEHPHVAANLNGLTDVLLRRERFPDALPLFAQALRIAETQRRTISSETRMRTALDQSHGEQLALAGLLLSHPTDETLQCLVMTTALLRKGRSAEAGTLANRLLHQTSNNPQQKELFEKWQQVRQQRETLLFGGLGKLSPSDYQRRLTELGQQADDMESQLAASLPELRKFHPPKFDDILSAVATRLPKDGALIEVLWVAPFNFKAKGTENTWLTPHYLALVMTADQHIQVKDLGDASIVDNQVQALLSALRSPSSDPKEKAKALYDQILKPLLSSSMKHVYLSVDGSLNLVPFDALHDGTDYLLGRKTFHYLTSGRDLSRIDTAEAKQPALLIADPDFGQTGHNQGNAGPETFYQRLSGLSRLAGAQQEAKQLGGLLHVAPIVGSAAKESVVRSAQAPWLVHIASHGLFLKGRDLPRAGGRGGSLFGSPLSERKLVPLSEGGTEALEMRGDSDSLSRSALVLADAAKGEGAASTAEDGLLTAEEARSLDLFGTQLVVLSACDTGQGELSVGQGVYGLRRAFLVAGAETLVTSLWQVNDAATGKLMTLYYQKLLKEKRGRLQAMQEAMQEMRKKYKHPYYWAPFLVIGSDGPMRPPSKLLTPSQTVQK